jgi:hypothetical protein
MESSDPSASDEGRHGSPQAATAWQRSWVDEEIPALGGLTPHEAADDLESRPLLEALLRDLEWRWEASKAGGSAVPDIESLREELGMEDWTAAYEEDGEEDDELNDEDESVGDSDAARRRWVVPPAKGRMRELELEYLNPADEDDRRFLILAEHPELWDAIDEDLDEIEVEGQTLSPRMHVLMHEAVTTQIWGDEPPEVWLTAVRLTGLGYERHEVLHMLAGTLSGEIWMALHEGKPYDRTRHLAALRALPKSWEQERQAATQRKPTQGHAWHPTPVTGHPKRRR